jgi:hypothetical protein
MHGPTTVAAQSNIWTVFTLSNCGIVGSNASRGMDICKCVYSVFVLSYVEDWSLVQGVLPTVFRIKKLKKWPVSNTGAVELLIIMIGKGVPLFNLDYSHISV